MTQYWHMQMHPDDQSFSEVLHSILENKKIIGLENGLEDRLKRGLFNRMKVNDIVAIKKWWQINCISSGNWWSL